MTPTHVYVQLSACVAANGTPDHELLQEAAAICEAYAILCELAEKSRGVSVVFDDEDEFFVQYMARHKVYSEDVMGRGDTMREAILDVVVQAKEWADTIEAAVAARASSDPEF